MNAVNSVGSMVVSVKVGQVVDTTKEVWFEAEEIGQHVDANEHGGDITTLYRTEEGRLIAHVKTWTSKESDPVIYDLIEVADEELRPGGEFEELGEACGYGRPLGLDQGLTLSALPGEVELAA